MPHKKYPLPPRWVSKFFQWYCHPDYYEDIEGDLLERFESGLEEHGLKNARWNYIKDVVRLFRPGIIRSLEISSRINHYSMFKNYLKVGYRNILKHKGFSLINVTGLAIGIACCIIIMLYVQNELSYDRYHKNYNQTYRVLQTFRSAADPGSLPPPAPEEFQVWGCAPIGPALQADFPEIKSFFRFTSPVNLLFQYQNKKFQEDNMVFADSTAFKVFSWRLISGREETALTKPNSIVLTQNVAAKYFGKNDPLGKTITIDQTKSFVVTGVMEDVPHNSHFTFDGLISMTTAHNWRTEIFDWWGYVDFYTYFLVDEQANIAALAQRIPDFVKRHLPGWQDNTIAFEPLSDAYLYSVAARQPGAMGSLSNIYMFSSIAVFILIIACINFMNLSTARSMERAKEIGIRKSIGAHRHSLVVQFLLESILLSTISAILAVALVSIALPWVQELSAKTLDLSSLLSWKSVIAFMGGVFLIGLLAGSYPAWILAQVRSAQVLKGTFKSSSKGAALRKSLVIFQLSLSIALIAGTAIVFSQLDFIRSRDLGFTKEQMLVIDFGWDSGVQEQLNIIKAEFLRHPDVHSIAASRAVPGNFLPDAGTRIESPEGAMIMQSPGIYEIEPDFVPTYDMQMIAGRSFSANIPKDSTETLLLNEAAMRLYGYTDPSEIVGKKFSQWGRNGIVVGVVKDFNYKSLHTKVEPLALRFAPVGALRHLSLQVSPENITKTIA
ncbi:ABC transporter permease [Fulvivirga imtechensis]|nr:ABC transporter permease [Fulvivirga imtechensis]